MYSLLIVDDERTDRGEVWESIAWQDFGFEVVGEAANGLEGLEMAEKLSPDVICTDIRMPFMDGLEMARRIRQKNQTTTFIILSGYDEFDYARQAIQVDVAEYVLKPVSRKEFAEILQRVRQKLDQRVAEAQDIEKLRKEMLDSRPLLQNRLISSLMAGIKPSDCDEAMKKAERYGLNLQAEGYIVAAFRINQLSKLPHFEYDPELMHFAVLNICNEIIQGKKQGYAFLYNDDIILLGTATHPHQIAYEQFLAALNQMCQIISKYLRHHIDIGVGELVPLLSDIHLSYAGAQTALDNRLPSDSGSLTLVGDVEQEMSKDLALDERVALDLLRAMKSLSEADVIASVQDCMEPVQSKQWSFRSCQFYAIEVIMVLTRAARESRLDANDFGCYRLIEEIQQITDIGVWTKRITDAAIRIRNGIVQSRAESREAIIAHAKEYIDVHYADSDLNVDTLCQLLHVSAAHFSTLFKKQTGQSFTSYLTMRRMEAAQKLLRETSLKAAEIALMVGYSEPNYFSFSFKKNCGCSPREYRKQ